YKGRYRSLQSLHSLIFNDLLQNVTWIWPGSGPEPDLGPGRLGRVGLVCRVGARWKASLRRMKPPPNCDRGSFYSPLGSILIYHRLGSDFFQGHLCARLSAAYLRAFLCRAFPCESIWLPRLKRKLSWKSRMSSFSILSVTPSSRLTSSTPRLRN